MWPCAERLGEPLGREARRRRRSRRAAPRRPRAPTRTSTSLGAGVLGDVAQQLAGERQHELVARARPPPARSRRGTCSPPPRACWAQIARSADSRPPTCSCTGCRSSITSRICETARASPSRTRPRCSSSPSAAGRSRATSCPSASRSCSGPSCSASEMRRRARSSASSASATSRPRASDCAATSASDRSRVCGRGEHVGHGGHERGVLRRRRARARRSGRTARRSAPRAGRSGPPRCCAAPAR